MQTEKNIWLRMLSMILTLALLISCVPNQVYAMAGEALADLLEATDTAVLQPNATPDSMLSTAHIVAEDVSKRGESYKEYIMNNGLRYATVYPSAIHYEADGQWKDIDNSLVAAVSGGKAVYQNAAGAWSVKFPQRMSGSDMISITKDSHTVQFGMAGEMRSTGDLVVASIGEIGNENTADALAVNASQTAIAQIQEIDLTAARAAAEHPETVLDKLNSRLAYANVYPDTNVVYDLQDNQLKETVVLQRYDASLWGYRYTLNTGDLVPILREDQQIDLCHPETNEVILTMPAPYMQDHNGETSGDVEVVLTPNGSNYLLSYYLPREWLADTSRTWPVILDPVVTLYGNYSNVQDVRISENIVESYSDLTLECGHTNISGVMRSYVKFITLPQLPDSAVIVDAEISLYRPINGTQDSVIEVHKVTSPWKSQTLTWNDRDNYDRVIADYVVCRLANRYRWNITSIVSDWYANENNNGVMFKASDEIEDARNENWKQFYSSDMSNSVQNGPQLAITYQVHNGLEDYWSYSSVSAGRAGTGYVNLFTGNLTWVRGDLGFDGNRMPVSISHVYNANDSQRNDFGVGFGWRTNYNQTVTSPSSGVYVWEDGDGTRHYFYQAKDSSGNAISNTYLDEDGLHLTLTTGGSGDQKYTLTDQYGNKSYFDETGRLVKMENNQQVKSNITVAYATTTSKLISTITDGAGRVYQFHYQSNLLSKISYLGNDTQEDTYVSYTYDNGDLVEITDKDTLYTTYSYDDHLLTRVEDLPGKNADGENVVDYYITFSYEEDPTEKPVRPVSAVKEFDYAINETLPGNSATFDYGTHNAVVTDHSGNKISYQFNDWGNLVSVHDSESRTQYTKYALNDVHDQISNSAEPHQIIEISDIDGTVNNRIVNSSFEGSIDCWYKGSGGTDSVIVSGYSYQGEKSLMITNGNLALGEPIWLQPGETYTFSVYIYAESNAEAYISFESAMTESPDSSKLEGITGEWVRLQVSFTNEDIMSGYIRPKIVATDGTVYVDCVQLEKAAAASPYNAVENGDFEISYVNDGYLFNGWSEGSDKITEDCYKEVDDTANTVLGNGSLYIEGNPYVPKMIEQTQPIQGEKGDTFVLSGWAKADAAPLIEYPTGGVSRTRAFGLKLIFKNQGVVLGEHYVSFDPDISGNYWQYAAVSAVADDDFDSITIQMVYSYQVNVAFFDGIQLTEGGAGTRYEYDSNKNVVKETNVLGQATEYTYYGNGIDLQSVKPAVGSEVSYTYDAYHNVKTMVETTENPDGSGYTTTYAYEYDGHGNVLSVTVTQEETTEDHTETLKQNSRNMYTSDGNYISATTNSYNETTYYGYDSETGVLLWVQYPGDTVETRTEYEYDTMYRAIKISATPEPGVEMFAQYTYHEDMLATITTGSNTTYALTYNDFDLRTSVHVGNRTLATYSYTKKEDGSLDENHHLERLDYGNGNRVEYKYDRLGRIIREEYYETPDQTDPSRVIRYSYDNTGVAVRKTDSVTGMRTLCYYDSAARVATVEETNNKFCHIVRYRYDENGNVVDMQEYFRRLNDDPNQDLYYPIWENIVSYKYLYDYKNRLAAMVTDKAAKEYSYDGLNRLTEVIVSKIEGDTNIPILSNQYTYADAIVVEDGVGETYTGNRISKVEIDSSGLQKVYEYTYDANGNITSVSDGIHTTTYVYDAANQLVRENNQAAGKTWKWTYDNAGNILLKEEFAYTTGTLGTLSDFVVYGYQDATWGDLLTSYDGKAITYDEIGNPLSDGTWTYTWQQGRQLATMSKDFRTWSFEYDANGMRTRRTSTSGIEYIYVYNGTQLSGLRSAYNDLHFTYDAAGVPLTVTYHCTVDCEIGSGGSCGSSCGTFYYVTNLQGDVIALLDSSGNKVAEYAYDAWGNPIELPDAPRTQVGVINPLRYRGYVYDEETGLYYLQSRYYDPEIGRFINADSQLSTGDFSGLNLFAYCGNNPVNRVDPNGHAWYHWAIGAAIVAGFAIATVVTCGGFAAAATAVGLVSSGIALSSATATAVTAAFIGSATMYGTAALVALGSSSSLQDFADQGNWGTVLGTALAAGFGMLNGYNLYRSQPVNANTSNSNNSSHITGRGSPKENPVPNGSYTQVDDFGNIYSYTQFDSQGRQTLRIDFQGRPHNGVLPHIHLFTYPERGGRAEYVFDLSWNLKG